MTAIDPFARSKGRWLSQGVIATLFVAALAVLILVRAGHLLPPGHWAEAMSTASPLPHDLLFRDSFVPRIAIALLAGAGLGLAGTLFQQALRNPLAEPATLGVSAGAQLSLSMTLLWAPGLYGALQGPVALAGGASAFVVVLLIAASAGFSAVGIVVAGLIVSQLCGSLSAILVVLNHDYLSALFIWQSGSLAQNGWAPTTTLFAEIVPLSILCCLVIRPLEIMVLQDDSVRSLGVSVWKMRTALLGLAVALSACVTSAVGVIGFIGLAAPALSRSLGARTLRQRFICAPLLGAYLLTATDQLVQTITFTPQEIPTGAATGLLGAPLLIWLVFRLRPQPAAPRDNIVVAPRLTRIAARRALIAVSLVFAIGLVLALTLSHPLNSWHISSWPEFGLASPWRAPRVFASLACGAMLATAGVLMQRMTGNAVASPEILGISSGATVAVILAMLLVPGFDPTWTFPAACIGAMLTLAVLLGISGRHSFSPERLLITGVALASLMTAISSTALSSGDPRVSFILTWISGSTYGVTASQAALACVAAALTLAGSSVTIRWLEILPLGAPSARAVGVNVSRARLALLLLTAVAASAATLIVGPLSFVGLMAPHMARMLGMQRPGNHLFGAAIIGALIMIFADVLGRTIVSPWQLPTGLLATLIGAPYFLLLMRRIST